MARPIWTETMSVGVEVLDADHHRSSDLIAQMEDCLEAGDLIGAQEAVSLLVADTTQHFRREEGLLKDLGYPGCQAHARHHQQAMDGLLDAQRRLAAGEDAAPILAKIKTDFVERLVLGDMEYKWWLLDQGVSRLAGGRAA